MRFSRIKLILCEPRYLRLALVATAILLPSRIIAAPLPEKIKITPRSCIIEKTNDQCNKPIIISWNFKQPTSFCVYLDNNVRLFCENMQTIGERKIAGKVTQSTTFHIRDIEGQKLSQITVYLAKRKNAATKKRYSHPWSIF